MVIGPEGMSKLIGTLALNYEQKYAPFRLDPEEFIRKEGISDKELSEEEKRFLRNPYILDIIKDFIFRLSIKYDTIDKRC
jgi:hypothetical protein